MLVGLGLPLLLLAAYPQEVVFRSFFFQRYQPFAPRPPNHDSGQRGRLRLYPRFLRQPGVSVIAGLEGIFFGYRHRRSRFLVAAGMEHGLWGNPLYTLGLEWFFYSGCTLLNQTHSLPPNIKNLPPILNERPWPHHGLAWDAILLAGKPRHQGERKGEAMLCDNPACLQLPSMLKLRQHFDIPPAIDPAQALEREFAGIKDNLTLTRGARVAVGVGSRGISGLAEVVGQVVQCLRSVGAEPFILPAMGSHGGATAQGQIEVLGHRGVTEQSCGAPIRATMEVVSLGATDCGIPLFINRLAFEADGLVLINRIKPHTNFIGPTESGILKMLSIGLGNQAGAEYYHRLSLVRPQYEILSTAGREVMKRTRFLFGAALVENQNHQLCQLRLARLGAHGTSGDQDAHLGPRLDAPPAHGPSGPSDS